MKFKLPPLSYENHELMPYISEDVVYYHYMKHTKDYYDTTNKLIVNTIFEKHKSLQDLIADKLLTPNTKLFNNACQAFNHTFYWNSLIPSDNSNNPTGKLLGMIEDQFKSLQQFKNKFIEESLAGFGSYWTWLLLQDDELIIKNMSNAGCPLSSTHSQHPLLVIDLFEHAYYLQYPADKRAYLSAIWNIINWDIVSERLDTINKQ